jgi:nucleoid-associated protein YgaU
MSTQRLPTTRGYDLFKAAVTFILLFAVFVAVWLNSGSTQAAEQAPQPTLVPVTDFPPTIEESAVVLVPSATPVPTPVEAEAIQPADEGSGDGQDYIVEQGDWLMGLARRFYGDDSRSEDIYNATNAKAADDPSYATIDNPNILEPGWKIWIPFP